MSKGSCRVLLGAMLMLGAGAAEAETVIVGLDPATSPQPWMVILPPGHKVARVEARLFGSPAGGAARTLEVRGVSTQGLAGDPVATGTVVLPAEVDPGPGVRIELTLHTRPAGTAVRPRLRWDPAGQARHVERLRRLVANPGDVERWSAAARLPHLPHAKTSPRPRAFRPTFDPSLDGSGVRYLIVTSEALAPAFQVLADYHTRRGLPAQVRTLEWILSRTRQGIDTAETLRNFLVEAYQLWGIEYVLLGGDTDLIPARYGHSSLYTGSQDEFVPTDMYYACLDGTWNEDGDALWGEGQTLSEPADADILPELAVARAPVRSVQEVNDFVSKVIGYQTPRRTDYQQNVLFLHEVLVPANWDTTQTVLLDGAPTAENLISQTLPPGMQPTRLYDTYWLYPGSSKLSRAASIQQMEQGFGIVNHLGHGYRYNMSLGDLSLVNSNADVLANGEATFLLFLANCTAVAFDFDCLAEHYLRNPGNGAAAVIGAARSVSATFVILYNEALFTHLFTPGDEQLAVLLNTARLERAAAATFESQDRQLQFSLNALGDPAMRIFTGPVAGSYATHVDTVTAGTDTLQVQVFGDSLPFAGATVCAFKQDEVYAVGTTDSTGGVALAIAPATAGDLLLTWSGRNLVSHTDTLQVLPAPPPLVRVASVTIDDDSLGASRGNGDGFADAGETLELHIDFANTGGTVVGGVTATLASPDTLVTVVQDTSAVDTLGTTGAPVAATTAFVVHVDAQVPDGTTFDLPLVATAAAGTWNDTVHLAVAAPRLEVTHVVQDPAAQTLVVSLVNRGSGPAPPLVATLSAAAPVVVLQDSVTLGGLASLGRADLPAFGVDTSGGFGQGAVVQIGDAYGRQLVHAVDFIPPFPPATPVPDPTAGSDVVRLTWSPSLDADLYGYHVFRALLGDTTFARVSADAILHADYRDATIQPNSKYTYYVVAVDSSRQWSAPSDTIEVTTTAALLPGWPLEMQDPTGSSVAVGDLDGDSRGEVVVGAVGLYAWRADGLEVVDGDAVAGTFGILSDAVGQMNASVALADMDGVLGQEIVAAPWLSNALYVFRADGSVLPGWPQQPANGGNAGYWASPAVDDLDGDGSPEVVAISKDGWLYGWHADGSPLVAGTDGKLRFISIWTQNTPALADLTDDGRLDIVVAATAGSLYVVQDDGTDVAPFPIWMGGASKSSPALGDVDGDGQLDIVTTTINGLLHVFDTGGNELAGWPAAAPSSAPDFGPSPALGDLDADGDLEIVYPVVPATFKNSELRVYDHQGNVVLSRPLGNYTQVSPVLADLDGDGGIDIVQGGEAGILYAWDLSGNDLDGFPIALGDFVRGTPTYTDVDLDGMGDLVFAGWNRKVYVWRMLGPYRPDRAPWPGFHGGPGRTGVLPLNFATDAAGAVPGVRPALAWWPNPFNPRVTLEVSVPGRAGAVVPVVVDVFDVRGRRVRRLFHGDLAGGASQRLVWDGRDDAQRAVASGVYLVHLRAGDLSRRGKITLMR